MNFVGVDPQKNNVTFTGNIGEIFGNDTTALPVFLIIEFNN